MSFFRSFIFATFMSVLVLGMPALSHADETVETLYNPLQKTVSSDKPVQSIAKIIINALFGIAGSVALVMFVWGGFLWLTSAGNSKQVEQGKQVFIWASLGIVMMFSAYAILNYIFSSLTNPSSATAPPIEDYGPPASAAGGGGSSGAGGGQAKAGNQFCSNQSCKEVTDAQCADGFGYTTMTACNDSIACDNAGKNAFCTKTSACADPAKEVSGISCGSGTGYKCCIK